MFVALSSTHDTRPAARLQLRTEQAAGFRADHCCEIYNQKVDNSTLTMIFNTVKYCATE